MSIDEPLETIRELYNNLTARLNQSEELKDAVSIDELGKIVRAARITQGLTRQALCELSGVSYSTLNKIETGSVSVRLDIVINVVTTLGMKLWVG